MDRRDAGDNAGLVGAGILVLTLASVTSIYRAAGDAGATAFVAVSYAALLLLLRLLRDYERAPPGQDGGEAARERLRLRVWCLCTLLTGMFAWRVAGVLMQPWPAAAAAVWALAVATSAGGVLLLCRRPPPSMKCRRLNNS